MSRIALATLLVLSLAASVASAQMRRIVTAPPGGDDAAAATAAPLSEEQKRAVIGALIEAIDEAYLFPDRVAAISTRLTEAQDAGRWSDHDDPGRFAREVTAELRAETSDLHFSLRFQPGRAGRMGGGPGAGGRRIRVGGGAEGPEPGSELHQAMMEMFAPNNFSLRKLEVLDGNIGYMRMDMFPPLFLARPTLDAAMAFLSHTDALIIDLRGTPGGVGGFVPYLASYFFDDPAKLLYSREWGAEDRVEEYTTQAEIGGTRRGDLPLYILTDSMTGSAAENLSYTLKHHGRATIVGETTVGGGHSAQLMPLVEGFTASIPAARVVHPVTGRGFDSVGVKPNIEVPGPEALKKAHTMSVEHLMESAPPQRQAALRETLREIQAEQRMDDAGEAGPDEDLEELAGIYGVRSVFVSHGTLRYQRQGGPPIALKRIGKDLYKLDIPSGARAMGPVPDVRFDRDDRGRVKGLSLVARDGTVSETSTRSRPEGSDRDESGR